MTLSLDSILLKLQNYLPQTQNFSVLVPHYAQCVTAERSQKVVWDQVFKKTAPAFPVWAAVNAGVNKKIHFGVNYSMRAGACLLMCSSEILPNRPRTGVHTAREPVCDLDRSVMRPPKPFAD